MEAQFNLESHIQNWKTKLSKQGLLSQDNIAELEAHLQDEMELLLTKDLSEEESFYVAQKRLGQIKELSVEYNKVYTHRSIFSKVLPLINGMLIFISILCVFNLTNTLNFQYFFSYGAITSVAVILVSIVLFFTILCILLRRSDWKANTTVLIVLILSLVSFDIGIGSLSDYFNMRGRRTADFNYTFYQNSRTIIYGTINVFFYILSLYVYYKNRKDAKMKPIK